MKEKHNKIASKKHVYHRTTEYFDDNEDTTSFSWVAPEYVYKQKSSKWYIYLALISIVILIFLFLLTKEIVTSLLVIILASIFGYYAARKPKDIDFSIDNNSIDINHKNNSFESFKSYSYIEDEGIVSISFMPVRRFSPILPIYVKVKDAKLVIDLLSQKLPYNKPKDDIIDNFFRRINF